MRMQNGMNLVLDPRAMANDLIASRNLTAEPFGRGIG